MQVYRIIFSILPHSDHAYNTPQQGDFPVDNGVFLVYDVATIQGEGGKLYADSEFERSMRIRTPDYDSIKLKRANKYLAEITIDMICDDGSVESALITLKNEDGVWKLDSSVL